MIHKIGIFYLFSFCQLGQGHNNSIYANYCAPFYLTHPVNFPCERKPTGAPETSCRGERQVR
jgi:hypothetical protein